MSNAYRHLRVPLGATEATPSPTMLRPVPPSESEPETIESATTPPEAAPSAEAEPAPEAESTSTVPTIASPEAAPSAEAEPELQTPLASPVAAPSAEAEPAPEASFTSPLTIPPAEDQTTAEPAPEPIQLKPAIEQPVATPSEGAPDSPASDSLQLSISATSGSLDLKAVDRSINEIPAVVDVTLLDYDGRNATLKVWITETADPVGVREALLESLHRNFGDGQDTEVSIDLEGEQA